MNSLIAHFECFNTLCRNSLRLATVSSNCFRSSMISPELTLVVNSSTDNWDIVQSTSVTIVVTWKRIKFSCFGQIQTQLGDISGSDSLTLLLLFLLSLQESSSMLLVPSMDLGDSGSGSTGFFKGVRWPSRLFCWMEESAGISCTESRLR